MQNRASGNRNSDLQNIDYNFQENVKYAIFLRIILDLISIFSREFN